MIYKIDFKWLEMKLREKKLKHHQVSDNKTNISLLERMQFSSCRALLNVNKEKRINFKYINHLISGFPLDSLAKEFDI